MTNVEKVERILNFKDFSIDVNAINQAIPIEEVIKRYTSIDTTQTTIKCPSIAHEDKRPSAKIYHSNGQNHCYCFACNKSFKVIDLAKEQYSGNFRIICAKILDDFNLPIEQFSNYNEVIRNHNIIEKRSNSVDFPLSMKDLAEIGLPFDAKDTYQWLKEKNRILSMLHLPIKQYSKQELRLNNNRFISMEQVQNYAEKSLMIQKIKNKTFSPYEKNILTLKVKEYRENLKNQGCKDFNNIDETKVLIYLYYENPNELKKEFNLSLNDKEINLKIKELIPQIYENGYSLNLYTPETIQQLWKENPQKIEDILISKIEERFKMLESRENFLLIVKKEWDNKPNEIKEQINNLYKDLLSGKIKESEIDKSEISLINLKIYVEKEVNSAIIEQEEKIQNLNLMLDKITKEQDKRNQLSKTKKTKYNFEKGF